MNRPAFPGCVLTFVLAGVAVSGCIGPQRSHAVPADRQNRAVIPGMPPGVRTWSDEVDPAMLSNMSRALAREQPTLTAASQSASQPNTAFLAISGGGANGAFAAGFLNGWTAAGTRPEFKVVTGISTGALIAPFAFLGREYDEVLHRFYTTLRSSSIFETRALLTAALFDDALTDNRPLRRLVAQVIDRRVVQCIAEEYAKGRVLLIGTTNLDAGRAVIWDIGAIAASGHPQAVELIRRIMIASAAIPAAFPPVLIDVEVDGQHYQEMHVDGGALTQVFLYPPSLRAGERAEPCSLYIIRNARLDPDWADVERRTLPIAGRAIEALISAQGIGDLYRLYLQAQNDRIDYNLACIPASFRAVSKEPFDRDYMNKLYQVGYDLARNGYSWQKTPPGLITAETQPSGNGWPR